MSRTPTKITQAEIARAIRAADACGKVARMKPDGSIEFVERAAEDVTPVKPVETRERIRMV